MSSQLKVNSISDAAGANGNAITLATDGTCTAKVTNNLSNRRLTINGAFNVAQRGTTANTSGYKTVDRFKIGSSGMDEVPTQAQVALTSSDTGPWAKGFRYALQVTNGNQTSGAGAADYIYIYHYIEAQDIASSGWDYTNASSKLTLSFWVKSSVAQNFYGYVKSQDGTAQLLTFETTALTANTWKKVTVSIPGHANLQFDNNTDAGFQIAFTPFFGTDYTTSGKTLNAWAAYSGSDRMADFTSTWFTTNDSTFALTGVQLEVGDHATDFEHRSYSDELIRCQRYYEILAKRPGGGGGSYDYMGMWYSGSEFTASVRFQVDKRVVPTFEQVSGTNYYTCYGGGLSSNINSWTGAQAPTVRATTIYNNNTVSGGTAGQAGWISLGNDAAVLAVSAEI